MFDKNSNYLSGTCEVLRLEWTGEPFEKIIPFYGVELSVNCDRFFKQNQQKFTLELTLNFLQEDFLYANSEYMVILEGQDADDSVDLKNSESYWYQFSDLPENEHNFCLENWCENINGKKYLTFNLWKKNEPDEEKRVLDLTDGIITAQEQKFSVNVSVLARYSKVIFNMIKDLKQSQNFNDPVDFSTLFENFSGRHIHMYLCFVYNQNFQFFLLHDIIEVLKICIKLDCQNMITYITNMQNLGKIVREQSIVDPDESENPCHVKNLLEFSAKHGLYNMIVYCQLQNASANKENKFYPKTLHNLSSAYKNLG